MSKVWGLAGAGSFRSGSMPGVVVPSIIHAGGAMDSLMGRRVLRSAEILIMEGTDSGHSQTDRKIICLNALGPEL